MNRSEASGFGGNLEMCGCRDGSLSTNNALGTVKVPRLSETGKFHKRVCCSYAEDFSQRQTCSMPWGVLSLNVNSGKIL